MVGTAMLSHKLGVLIATLALLLSAALPDTRAQSNVDLRIVPQLGHAETIAALALSPDGRYLVSGGRDNAIKIWEFPAGALVRTIDGHEWPVTSLAVTPDGRQIVSGSADNSIRIWDFATGQLISTILRRGYAVEHVLVTPDGSRIVSDGDVWELATGNHLLSFPDESDVSSVTAIALTPDGRRIATGRADGSLQLWDLATGKLSHKFKNEHIGSAITALAVMPDKLQIVSGSENNRLNIWNLTDGTLVRSLTLPEGLLNCIAITPDGRYLLSGGSHRLEEAPWSAEIGVWDIATGKSLRTLGGTEIVSALAITSDGARVVAGDWGNNIELWDIATGKFGGRLGSSASSAYPASIAVNDRHIAARNENGTIKIWDARTGALVRSFAARWMESIAFTPDGQRLLASGYEGWISFWNVESGALERRFSGGVEAKVLVGTPDGQYVVSTDQRNSIMVWESATGKIIREISGHRSLIRSLAITPDSRRIVSASEDTTVKVWDIETGALLNTLYGHNKWVLSVTITPDGKRIVSAGNDNTIWIWNIDTGAPIKKLDVGRVDSVTATPDGSHVLARGSWQKFFELINIETGASERKFVGHGGEITSVVVSSDGRQVVSGSEDGTVRVWDLASGRELATLVSGTDGGRLALTPQGYFSMDEEGKGASYFKLVDGLKAYDVRQFYQALYRPELLAELLKGDPEGKYEAAAAELNLRRILDSGPAPRLELKRTERIGGKVRVTVEITDDGGGIGKVEWRVNGVLQEGERAGSIILEDEPVRTDERSFPLTAGGNEITMTAYNRAGLITSPPVVAKIDGRGIAESDKAQLHILAIGIDAYAQSSLQLNYAVNDAQEFSETLKRAAEELGLFSTVSVKTLLNEDVTRDGLDKAFSEMAATIKPADKFVFFAAGHAKVYKDNYYFFPQDLRFGGGDAITTQGIDQDTWQSWFGRIPARASVLIYDTCEAGQLTTAMRGGEDISTAIDLLKHATGRSILAATTAEDAAREGFEGHGVFTFALLRALSEGDLNKDGQIEIIELGQFVERAVPGLSSQRWGIAQRPRFTIQANFPIARPISAKVGNSIFIPKEPTHVAIMQTEVTLEERGDTSKGIILAPGTTVRLLKIDGTRALIARNGQMLGYVPGEVLLPLQ